MLKHRLLVATILFTPTLAYLFPRSYISGQHHFSLPNAAEKPFVDSPAGYPNLATTLEITSNSSHPLTCALPTDKFHSGYAHFTNSEGEEDKHMFWLLFEARHNPESAPLVMSFGGGPGASGLLFPFSGAGPCVIQKGKDGKGEAVPSPYSWTEDVNFLAIDHPVGVGFSYGTHLRNSSGAAAWDVDDFLQEFWKKFPHLAKNQFMINSGSYGGTFMPHVINIMHNRNTIVTNGSSKRIPSDTRIRKMPDSVMLVNVWSDALTHFRWFHESDCNPKSDGNVFFNASVCEKMVSYIPPCLDAIQYAYEQPSVASKMEAMVLCSTTVLDWDEEHMERNPYDYRQKCPCDFLNFSTVEDVLNGSELRNSIGVPKDLKFQVLSEEISTSFVRNGDMIQPVYLLLAPAINAGLRVFVYNGMYDGVAPWRSSLAWMRLLKMKHQAAFRAAPEREYPGVGTIQQVGTGAAGEYTFIKIRDAGHMVIQSQPELLRHLMRSWLKNEPFF